MDALATQIREIVRTHVPGNARIVVGLSGGIDSVVMLHLLVRQLRISRRRISAIHVNHQISPHASRWATFCRRWCRELGVSLRVAKVEVRRGNSTEAAARAARYAVFAASKAGVVALAHNRDDQAETVLLQLLRGAGVRGLAAMPVLKTATATMPAVLRPLLKVPRKTIEAYAQRHRLQWVEDDSNQDRNYLRNFVRHDVLPLIEKKLPAAKNTLARAARHQAEASALLDMLAAQDVGTAAVAGRLQLSSLKRLDPARARNVLRYFLRRNDVLMPQADRLDEVLRQVLKARQDARVCVEAGNGIELRRFRDALYVVRALPPLDRTFELAWNGRGNLVLPQLGGSLRLARRKGGGISAQKLRAGQLAVRVRRGSEALRLSADGPRRTVRNLLQEAAMPPWIRERLPFLYIDGELAAVAGLGVGVEFQAARGAPGLLPVWSPDSN